MLSRPETASFCKTFLRYIQNAFEKDDFGIPTMNFDLTFPTLQYNHHSNELFIIEQTANFKLFLWVFELDIKHKDIEHHKYALQLYNEKNEKMVLNSKQLFSSFGVFLYQKTIVIANDSFVFSKISYDDFFYD